MTKYLKNLLTCGIVALLAVPNIYAVEAATAASTATTSDTNPVVSGETGHAQTLNTTSEQSTVDDQTLKFKLSSKLNNMYPGNNIEVTLFDNKALLTGQVKTKAIQKSLDSLAQEFPEIKSVKNFVSVAKNQSAAQSSKDAWITAKVTAKFVTTPGIASGQVKVVTSNGVVYLMGKVTKNQAIAIINNAKRIDGVTNTVALFEYLTK